ncbi:MAG: hypothetical protein JWR69_2131 [Pedosphaera sp.]|nr:hypothetical protein [Pedosphaera sp.]
MKVLIIDAESQLFLGHQDQWTDRPQEAKDLSFTAHARAVARGLKLKNFQVLFYFSDIDYRIVVCDSAGEPTLAKV